MPDAAVLPTRRRTRYVVLLVLLAALISNYWVLGLPFQLDDYTQIPRAVNMFGGSPAPESSPGSSAQVPAPAGSPSAPDYLFRPVLWLWLASVARLSPRPLDPWVFHAAAWALHALVAALLAWLLARRLGRTAALFGGLLFAVHPAGCEATSWIAAGGDLLMTLFLVLATMAATGPPPTLLRAGLAGIAFGLALLSKEHTIAALPPLALLLTFRRPFSVAAAVGRLATAIVPIALAYLLRVHALNTWSLSYAGGRSASLELLPTLLNKVPDLLRTLAAPWMATEIGSHPPVFLQTMTARGAEAVRDAWTLSAAVVAGAVGVVGVFGLFSHRLGAVFVCLVGLVCLAVPALFAAPSVELFVFSRTLYVLMVPVACVFGAGAQNLHNLRFLRFIAYAVWFAAAVAIIPISIDSLVHCARSWSDRGDATRRVAAFLGDHADRLPAGTVILFVKEDAELSAVPGIGPMAPAILAPPFARRSTAVLAAQNRRMALDSEPFWDAPYPISIVEWRGDQLESLGNPLPPRSVIPPDFESTDAPAEHLSAFRPKAPLPTRAVRALRQVVPAGPAISISWNLLAGEQSLERRLVLAESASTRVVTFCLDAPLEWVAQGTLDRITIAASGERLLVPPTALDAEVGFAMELGDPAKSLRLSDKPRLVLELPASTEVVRFTFEVAMSGVWAPAMTYHVPRTRLAPAGASHHFDPAAEDEVQGHLSELLRFETVPELHRIHLAPQGISRLDWRVRASALSSDRTLTFARSRWCSFSMVP